jgi:hypothetical protein
MFARGKKKETIIKQAWIVLLLARTLHQFCSDFELSVSGEDGGGSGGIQTKNIFDP